MFSEINKFHKTIKGYLVFGVVELLITYAFASLAIDRGNFLYYLLALIFLIGALQNSFKLIGQSFHARAKKHR